MGKPWPKDAVILVCSAPERADASNMDSAHPASCRDCGTAVVYSGLSMARASLPYFTRGRPVECLCDTCATAAAT